MGLHITLIGFGEIGKIFAADLLAGRAGRVSAYDILFDGAGARLAHVLNGCPGGAVAAEAAGPAR